MPTPLFRLDLARHLDPVLQLARARPDRVQLVAWAVRYLVENTDGLDVIIVERPGTLRLVEVLGAAWLDAVRRALGRESLGDVEAVVAQVTWAGRSSSARTTVPSWVAPTTDTSAKATVGTSSCRTSSCRTLQRHQDKVRGFRPSDFAKSLTDIPELSWRATIAHHFESVER